MTDTQLTPIPAVSLGETVCRRMRAAIVAGEIEPGEKLSEAVLAGQLHVSRSPVREAIHRLESEGLVERRANHGSYVWAPTEVDVDEIISLRVACESLAAEWAIKRLTEEDFAYLAKIIEDQQRAAVENDPVRLMQTDWDFHEYVVRRAGHRLLTEWWEHISTQLKMLQQLRWRGRGREPHQTIVTDHTAFLAALKRGDLDAITALHRRANEFVREEIKAALASHSTRRPE